MKLKEIERMANTAWSPAALYPSYVACGTSAQQLDASCTNSAVEIFRFDLEDPALECKLAGSVATEHSFNKMAWGGHGMADGDPESGVLVGGADTGDVCIWDAQQIIQGASPSPLHKLSKHTGAVSALDFNPFQPNLLASGAGDSDIFLWDLTKPGKPMTPGSTSQPLAEVTAVAWNRQVPHILGSALGSRCVVWDLKKSEPIVKITDSMSRIKSKLLAWHPDVATQLCLASEDDHTPVVQLWDLRFAAAPMRTLNGHQKGILSMAWCQRDSDLLMTCGKDNRILCWNPNSNVEGGEIVYELPTSSQWCYDVQWSPRNPQVISASSFDGHITMYSLMGGEMLLTGPVANTKVADSFGDFQTQALPQPAVQAERKVVPPLSKAPKWLKRPCGSSFSFGGKLVEFSPPSAQPPQPGQPAHPRCVNVSQVVTEPAALDRSSELERALQSEDYAGFCDRRKQGLSADDATLWDFIKGAFEKDPRQRLLTLIGFDGVSVEEKLSELSIATETVDTAATSASGGTLPADSTENVLSEGRSSAFDGIGDTLDDDRQQGSHASEDLSLNSSCDDVQGLLTHLLLTGHYERAVDVCIHRDDMAQAIILANSYSPDLLTKTLGRYFRRNQDPISRLVAAVVQKSYSGIISSCALESWREALALLLTYANAKEFPSLCDMLGTRLEASSDPALSHNAVLCYICSGNVAKFVECWERRVPETERRSSEALQDLVEKVMLLLKAVESFHGTRVGSDSCGTFSSHLSRYSQMLAAQGNMASAVGYIRDCQLKDLDVLQHRLLIALGQQSKAPWQTTQTVRPMAHHQPTPSAANPYKSPAARAPYTQPTPTAHYNPAENSSFPTGSYYNPAANTNMGAASMAANQPAPVSMATSVGYGGSMSQPGVFTPSAAAMPSSGGFPTASSTAQPSYAPTQPDNRNRQPSGGSGGGQFYGHGGQPAGQPASSVGGYYQPPAAADAGGSVGSSYGGMGSYGGAPSYGYQAPAQPTGSASSRGVLGKKYSSTPSGPAPSEPAPAPFNPAAAAVAPSQPQPGYSLGMHQPGVYQPSPGSAAGYAPAAAAPEPYVSKPVPSGWNDPPPVKAKQAQPAASVAPMMAPVYTPSAPAGTASMAGGSYYQGGQFSPAQLSPVSPKIKEPTPEPVPKGPVPAQHQVLQDVFGRIAATCMAATHQPLVKRKLEDVSRKLEILYDKLRAMSLSEPVLLGLHQIVQIIQQQRDYQTALRILNNMAAQGNFSEISDFMPGIKMLLQTAHQHGVYP